MAITNERLTSKAILAHRGTVTVDCVFETIVVARSKMLSDSLGNVARLALICKI
jgi:hypothetical protein